MGSVANENHSSRYDKVFGIYSQFLGGLITIALCSLPAVFSATENDRFQQKAMSFPTIQKGWLLLTSSLSSAAQAD